MKRLRRRASLSVAALTAVMAAVIFICAGTVHYWEAWVFLAVFSGATALTTADLLKRDPALLERRLRGGPTAEKEASQRTIMSLASLGFLGLVAVPALDRRFGWSEVPTLIVLAGDALVAVGFFLVALVFRSNPYASATVEVAADQRVVSTGPYAIVRHPMYASVLPYLVGTPLALGSWWGLAALGAMVPALIWRLLDEERVLERRLPGYREYQERVRYRLIPFVW